MKEDRNYFSPSKLYKYRVKAGYSQVGLSIKAGFDVTTEDTTIEIARYEQGISIPTENTIRKLAQILDCDYCDLLQKDALVMQKLDEIEKKIDIIISRGTLGTKIGFVSPFRPCHGKCKV